MPKQTFFNLPEDKKNKIMKSALVEFASYPYSSASVNRIVGRSQISKGSLYQYFNDKKDLYLYLVEIASQAKLGFLQSREDVVFDDFFAGFATLMIYGSEFDLNNPLHSKLLATALNGPLADESLAKMKKMSAQYMAHLLEQAQGLGQIRKDVPVDLMVYFLNSLTTDFARYAADQAGLDYFGMIFIPENLARVRQLDIQAMIRDLMKLVRDGLSPKKNNEGKAEDGIF